MNINKLTIYSTHLAAQIQFYESTLGLKRIDQSDEQVSFQIGDSTLTFIHRKESTPYHFAFNIPSNKEHEALAWLKERVEILTDGEHELHDFDSWNAKAVYFYDADRNIVEFIARKGLNLSSDAPFGSSALLSISEIGMPTENVRAKFNRLNETTRLPKYSGDLERFSAIGDESGLIICVNQAIKDWFPTNDTAHSSPFEMDFTNAGERFHLGFHNDRIQLRKLDT